MAKDIGRTYMKYKTPEKSLSISPRSSNSGAKDADIYVDLENMWQTVLPAIDIVRSKNGRNPGCTKTPI